MNKENKYLKQEFQDEVQTKLMRQIREHRKKQGLRQSDVAKALGIPLDTYQHWESPNRKRINVFHILSILHELEFSTAEIVDLLGLAPLTSSEIKAVCQDEDTLKSIQGNTFYSVMRKKCPDMDGLTLGKLLVLLSEENLKRVKNRQDTP